MTEAPNDERSPRPSQLVVVGSSAGGIDALLTLVAALPADFPAPVVLAQHIDPRRQSHLGEILTSRSVLPVTTVEAEEPLRSGTIYVVAADRDVEISDHTVTVKSDSAPSPRPSVDRLLATAARVFTDGLVAVILTGMGSDGAVGAQAVKAHGGTVIVQNPQTASFPGMPLAVPPSAVDIVVDLEMIGPLLGDLLSGAYTIPVAEDDAELRSFLDRVRDLTGLDFNAYKRPTIARRLQRRMAAAGTTTLKDYQHYVEHHPGEMQRLAASFLITVTEFFRDRELFDYLRDSVLPTLVAEARERGEFRIWSAGCATGEEAYTLAMLVTDLLGEEDADLLVRIFATDIAVDAVDFARRGIYPEAAVDDLPRDLVDRHFVRIDGAYEVQKHVRSLVVFGEHDLGYRAPFPRIDLILCRNVLIYFTAQLQRRALQLIAFSLRQGGYLALGKAESVNPLPEYFSLDQPRLKIFRREGDSIAIPTDRMFTGSPFSTHLARAGRRVHTSRRLGVPLDRTQGREPSYSQQAVRIIDRLSIGLATVDRNFHIRMINVGGRRLLGISTAAVGDDLIHRVAPALREPLRDVLDAALRGDPADGTFHVPDGMAEDDGRDLLIHAFPAMDDEAVTDEVVLEVVDVSALAQGQRRVADERALLKVTNERLSQRAERAVLEARALNRANQDMAAEIAKLRVDNEELLVAHEEAQSATEEIETLNEELQATNEELETLNEELQATVEELTTTNDELYARTSESQQLAAAREADRQQLEAILGAMSDAVLVVMPSGEPTLRNAAYDALLGDAESLIPEDDMGQQLPEDDWPQRRAARGESFTMPFTLGAPGVSGRWLEASGQPLLIDGQQRGGVVVIRDVTDRSLRRLQEQFLAVAGHELRTPLTALSLSLDLAARRLANLDDERLQQHIDRALAQTRKLSALAIELVDVVRLQSAALPLQRQPTELSRLTQRAIDTARLIAVDQTIDFHADEPVTVWADERRVEQVLLNLLVNAITFARGAGAIDVSVRSVDAIAEIEVRDRGPGIPSEALPHIFDRFYRVGGGSAQEGLGLGLYIAREIITAHGGIIEASSTDGDGATFVVRLPIHVTAGPTDEPNGSDAETH